jgi:hypothetical protein
VARIIGSTPFLAWTAVCCAVIVAFASWLADDSSGGVRALAALIGLALGLVVMLLVAWALAGEEPQPFAAASAPRPPAPAPEPAPPTPPAPDVRGVLAARLDEGRSLRDGLGPGAADARAAAWVDDVRRTLERLSPGVARYFAAIGSRPYADDAERLDAHLRRLDTVVRDML